MDPDLSRVQQQTFYVLECLFQDDSVAFRSQECGDLEVDSPETFDPVLIAEKLKAVADSLNKDAKFNAAMNDLKQAAAQEVLDHALSSGINVLVQSQVGQGTEVAPELQIIKASVAFGLYMKKAYPHMKDQLQSSIGAFLNQRVGSWVTQQGGWEQVANVTQP